MFSQSMKRRLDGTCKKEDDLTKMIEEFFSKQEQVESYIIVEGHPNWLVDVDGSLHIRKEELLSDGTLGFKLNNVSGNLICHTPRISSALLPKHLSGEIVFDVESLNGSHTQDAVISDDDRQVFPDEFGGIQYLSNTVLSEEDIRNKVLAALFEAKYQQDKFEVTYNLDEILKRYDTLKDKTYRLEIDSQMERVHGPNIKSEERYVDCHIYITDESNERKEVKMKAHEKAVYLLFLLYEDGISIKDFPKDLNSRIPKNYDKLKNLYINIQGQLKDNNSISVEKLSQKDITPILSKVRDRIAKITPNRKYVELFAIEGYREQPFKIEAATQEQRDLIIKTFRIEREKYGL